MILRTAKPEFQVKIMVASHKSKMYHAICIMEGEYAEEISASENYERNGIHNRNCCL
jgi:hypothetical protein